MTERRPWVLLAYRIPREPSTPRIALWRKLRQLGAAQIVDGLAALPADRRTREQFAWLAESVREAGGDAWLWESRLAGADRESALVAEMRRESSAEYRELKRVADAARRQDATSRRRTGLRMRRELRRVMARDYFAAPERAAASEAVERLAAAATRVSP